MPRNMDFHDEYVYRVVKIKEWTRRGTARRDVWVYGPYSTLGVAKSTVTRERRNQRSIGLDGNSIKHTTYIQRSKLMWEDV